MNNSATSTTTTAACCDCGKQLDTPYGKCPRCRAVRCRPCDDVIGEQVMEFMLQVGHVPPEDVEYCRACYESTS
jgi:hypothetical protein